MLSLACFFRILHEQFLTEKENQKLFFYFFLEDLYTNVEAWPDVKSLPTQLGQIGGIALNNANDELIVFSRGSRKWESR
jgi:hypothetical protein